MSEILHAGGADVLGPSIIDAAWTLGPWHVAPDAVLPRVHEKPVPDHGNPPSFLFPSGSHDSPVTSDTDRLLPHDGAERNVYIDPAVIHAAVAAHFAEVGIYQGPHPRDEMKELERRFHHRVARFEAVAGAPYEQFLSDPTLQAELSPKEKGLFHRAKQMDARLTRAHIETIAHNQEGAIRPQEPTEWDTHALTDFHQNGQLDASYFGLIQDSAPEGETAPLLTAYKPSSPSLKVLDDVQHAIRDGMSPLWLAGMPFAAVIGDRRLPPWKRAMMATTLLATTLYACNPIVPSNPGAPTPHGTLPPPGSTAELGPTLSAAQETGAMMAQTQEGRAFYDALTTHGVDSSACSPDVLGSLVVEHNLPLETVIKLTTIATDALANTPEPDHLTAMVCDAKAGANGTQTVAFYFSSDRDFTGDGTPDILIPSQAKVLLPGQLVDGVPEVVTPVVEGQPPAGSPVVAPNWNAAGGEIPAEIRGLMTVEEQSIRDSLTAQGIDPNSVSIHDVFRGSGNDFRMGSGVTNEAQTIAFYPKFDDNTDGFAWRPDLRLADRPWHWQSVSLPEGVNGKIEVVFDPKSEAPQFVAVTPDESHMMGWFNNLTGQWLTRDGNELTQTLSSTATLPATILAPATETPTQEPALLLPVGMEASLPPKDVPFAIIDPASVDARDVTLSHGMQFHLEVVTDKTVTDGDYPGQEINKLYLNDAVFGNSYGENAGQSVTHVAIQTYFDRALQSNEFMKAERDAREAKGQKLTLDDYKQWIAEAQAGTRPWEQVEFQVPADRLDGDTGLYKIEMVTARPDWMRVVLVDPTEKEIFRNISTNLRDAGTNLAVATHITKDGTIEIWVGFPFKMGGGLRAGQVVASYLLTALERMSWTLEENKNGPNYATWWPSMKDKYRELLNRNLTKNLIISAFAFDPPTDEPWNH